VVARNRPLLPAYVLLAAQVLLFAMAVHQQVPGATFGAVTTTVCLLWLLLRPGRLAAAVLVAYGCLEVFGPGTALLRQFPEVAASGQATLTVAAYAFHALLWVATLWMVVRGVRAIRRE
jgi:hypothetical protein